MCLRYQKSRQVLDGPETYDFCYASSRCTDWTEWGLKIWPWNSWMCVCVFFFLGLAGDAAAKGICKFQEWKNYSLLTRAHLVLLPHHLFLSSLTLLPKVFKIHLFLSLSIYGITLNPVLRGLQERFACDSDLLRVCHPWGRHGKMGIANCCSECSGSEIKQRHETHSPMSGVRVFWRLLSCFLLFHVPKCQLVFSLPLTCDVAKEKSLLPHAVWGLRK